MSNKKGRFIVIEGLDGCGKTTQLGLLRENLKKEGITAVISEEPTDGDTGKHIREILSGKKTACASELAALFTADRIYHNTKPGGIKELTDSGTTVISGRYYYSTFAYQGLETDLGWVMNLNLACPDIIKPDICIFLEADTAVCLERIRANRPDDAIEIFENERVLEATRRRFNEVFDKLSESETIVRIDASGTVEKIAADILAAVLKK